MSPPGANIGQGRGTPPPATAVGNASEDAFDADVIGVDVIGFSRFTQSLVDKKGAGAAEEVRDVLDIGFRAVADRLKEEGFVAVDSLGDGIVLARPHLGVTDLDRIARQAEQAFSAALGTLRVRAACASGRLSLCRVGGLQQRWDVVATGPAIEALHTAMRRKRALEPVRSASESGALPPVRSPAARPSGPARPIADIRRLAVAFVAIKPLASVLAAPLATLQDIASLGQGLSEEWGGHLEKVTHDDKGFLFDFGFARARDVGATALDNALDFILDIQPLLTQRGFTPHFGLAEGFVYRGALALGERTIPIVHGPAINLGAKLAASGEAELALDWTAAQKLVSRFRDFAAGIESALPNGVRYVGFALGDVARRPSAKPKSNELVGRNVESALLADAIAQLAQGIGGLIQVSGSEGIGKSKLLDSLRRTTPPSMNTHWLRADPRRALQHLSLWRDLTGPLARAIADSETEFASALGNVLGAAGISEDLHAVLDDVIPASGLMRSTRLDALEGVARRELLERAIVAIASTAVRGAPTLVCLDDAHWFDGESCRVLGNVLRATPGLLVVLTHRSGSYASVDLLTGAGARPTKTIALGPLRREDIKVIAGAISPILSQDETALDQIFNLSGGNPLHAEQIAHLLHERIAKSLATLARDFAAGPGMIDHVLDERLDGLWPVETQLVRMLSTFDCPISAADLQTLIQAGADAIEDALAKLSAHAFIDVSDDQVAVMKNRILIDAVIGRIPPREAQALHAGAARFVRKQHRAKQDAAATDAVIANHWRKAGEPLRAALGFGKAADGVLYAGAPDLAIKLYDEGLASLPVEDTAKAMPRVAGWYAGRAVAHWAQGAMLDARADAARALSLIDKRIGGPTWLPRIVRSNIARLRRTLPLPRRFRKWLVPRDVRAPLVTVSAIRAEMAFFLGDPVAVASASSSMLGFAGEPRLRARASARAYLFVGLALAQQPIFERAAHGAWNRARAVGEAANDPVASSHGHLGEAIWHMSHGRWRDARCRLEQASQLYADVTDPAYHKFVETLLALESCFRGDWQGCADRFAALHAVGVKQGNRSTEAWGLYGQAEALIIAGRWEDAEAFLALAEPIVESMPDRQSLIICKGLRIHIEFGRHRYQRALDRGLDGLALARVLTKNNFGSLEGFAAPAEVLLRLALDENAPASVRGAARANTKAALMALNQFATMHPIAVPRAKLCAALAARLEHRDADSTAALREGLNKAQALDMQFERRKLEAEFGARSSSDETNR